MQVVKFPPRISSHAVDRYRQRVEPLDAATAAARLAELAAGATRRPTPRQWTDVAPTPGLLFLYPHDEPDVCLVMKNNTIVTVFSRVICLKWRTTHQLSSPNMARRPPYKRPSPGSDPLEAA